MNTITAKINTKIKTPINNVMELGIFSSVFLLSFIDVRFALAGFICMASPIAFAVAGKGKDTVPTTAQGGLSLVSFCPLYH